MFAYRTPGVVFEWRDTRARGIDILRTDITGFVGIAERGPLHRPVRLESWTQFISVFGGHIAQGYLAYAVEGFFANGGQTCWVVRVADPDPEQARPASLLLLDGNGMAVLELTAASRQPEERDRVGANAGQEAEDRTWADPGVWGHKITVNVAQSGQDRFSLTLQLDGSQPEIWHHLSINPADAQYVEKMLNDPHTGSRLVRVRHLEPGLQGSDRTPNAQPVNLRNGSDRLAGGQDGLQSLQPEHFSGRGAPVNVRWGLATLESIDEISIIAIPDIMPKPWVDVKYTPPPPQRCDDLKAEPAPPALRDTPPEFPPRFTDEQIQALQNELVGQCERLKDRVAVLDSRIDDTTSERVVALRQGFDSTYAALYYPWLMVPDPVRLEGLLRAVPPSGHIAGVYARVDQLVGVHKPPANELLEGVLDVATAYFNRGRTTPPAADTNGTSLSTATQDVLGAINDLSHGDLNTQHVNVIRSYPGRGIRVAGARTLSKDSLWRFVNVRRLLLMIEETIDARTQWIVFEPNSATLWLDIDRIVRAFLNSLWRRGMLDGATAEEAYSVRCDATTNPPEATALGRVICEIGVLPPWPAEFVVVRIGKTENGTVVIESNRA